MEGKVLLQDLAQSLASKRKIQRKEAESFLKAFFETIREGIVQDKIVKIKGLGTFKMIDVLDRESVNVNTGERIVIPGHSKISFTPDTELKDQVNKPFALFQTVIINEGTSIEEMEKIEEPVSLVDESPVDDSVDVLLEMPVVQDEPREQEEEDVQEVQVVPEVPEYPESPKVPESPGFQKVFDDTDSTETPETSRNQEEPDETQMSDVQSSTFNEQKWWHISPAMTALLFAFFWIVLLLGYYAGRHNWLDCLNGSNKSSQESLIKYDTVYVEKKVIPDSLFIQSIVDSVRNEISKPTQKKAVVESTVPVAYDIIGYKGSRTINRGDYLIKIIREEYGNDDVLKYVISYNNFKNPNNLPVGTEVRLPKLRAK